MGDLTKQYAAHLAQKPKSGLTEQYSAHLAQGGESSLTQQYTKHLQDPSAPRPGVDLLSELASQPPTPAPGPRPTGLPTGYEALTPEPPAAIPQSTRMQDPMPALAEEGPNIWESTVKPFMHEMADVPADHATKFMEDVSEIPHFTSKSQPDFVNIRDDDEYLTEAERTYREWAQEGGPLNAMKMMGSEAAHVPLSLAGAAAGFPMSLPKMGLDILAPMPPKPGGESRSTGASRLVEEIQNVGNMVGRLPGQAYEMGVTRPIEALTGVEEPVPELLKTITEQAGGMPHEQMIEELHAGGGAEPILTAGMVTGAVKGGKKLAGVKKPAEIPRSIPGEPGEVVKLPKDTAPTETRAPLPDADPLRKKPQKPTIPEEGVDVRAEVAKPWQSESLKAKPEVPRVRKALGGREITITEGESFVIGEVVDLNTLLVKAASVPPKLRRRGIFTKLLSDLAKETKKDHPGVTHIEGNVISAEAEAAMRRFISTEELTPKETPPLLRTKIEDVTKPVPGANKSRGGAEIKPPAPPKAKKPIIPSVSEPAPVKPTQVKGKAKEPWEMSKDEFAESTDIEHGTTSPEVAKKIGEEGIKLMPPFKGILDIPESAFFLPKGSGLAKSMYSDTVLGKINPSAKILKAGTKEFNDFVKGIEAPEYKGMQEVLHKAKKAGYDIVAFKTKSTGWVALTDKAVDFRSHKTLVKAAISEGKPVPESVLADYPDLIPDAGKMVPISFDEMLTFKGDFERKLELGDNTLSAYGTIVNPKNIYKASKDYSPKQLQALADWYGHQGQKNGNPAQLTVSALLKTDIIPKKVSAPPGKPVPESVLKDYPDLIPDAGEKVATPKPVKTEAPPIPEEPQTIGLNKAENAALRADSQIAKLKPFERESFLESAGKAKKEGLDVRALELADEVLSSQRPISAPERAGMVLKARELANELDASRALINKFVDSGELAKAAKEAKKQNTLLTQIDRLTDASDFGARESARAVSIGRYMVERESMDITPVLHRAKANKGEALSPKRVKQYEKLVDAHKELNTKFAEMERKYTEAEAARAEAIGKQVTESLNKNVRRSKMKLADILEERAAIKKELADMGVRMNDVTGIVPEAAYHVGRLAVNYLTEKAMTYDQLVKKIQADVPDATPLDIAEAIRTQSPKAIKKARSEVSTRISHLKTTARLMVEIDKLEKGVFEAPSKKAPDPVNIRQLKKRHTKLRREAFRTITDPAKLEKALQAINELQDHLANMSRPLLKKRKAVAPEELTAYRETAKVLRETMRVEDLIIEANEQLRTGEFKEPVVREPKVWPADLQRAKIKLSLKKKEIRDAIDSEAPWTLKRTGRETANTLRTAKATADISAVFRQGLLLDVMLPGKAVKNFGRSLKAMFDEHTAEGLDLMIKEADHHYIREMAKLDLAELGKGRLRKGEEMFLSNTLEKIPGIGAIVRASERHMVTFLNLMRADAFDYFLEKHPNATMPELRAWADYINKASGRGDMGSFGRAAGTLSTVFFAPRFAVSRFQTPATIVKHWKHPRVRKEIAKNMAATTAVLAGALGLAKLAGAEISLDPRTPDFAKAKFDDTRIDFGAGFQQPLRLLLRIGLAGTDAAGFTGDHLTMAERMRFDPIEAIARFSSYKLAPGMTIPVELLRGRTIVGEEVTPSQTGLRALMPMVYEDIFDAYKSKGFGFAAATAGLNLVGVGTNTYKERSSKKSKKITH